MDFERLYSDYRPLLFSIAYRMLGLAQDAEDIVQDVFVALQGGIPGTIRDMKAYLCKMVTNRCINELKSARKTRAGSSPCL
jgi:RNA polymerase sigma-70 factor (ECF subfamily)